MWDTGIDQYVLPFRCPPLDAFSWPDIVDSQRVPTEGWDQWEINMANAGITIPNAYTLSQRRSRQGDADHRAADLTIVAAFSDMGDRRYRTSKSVSRRNKIASGSAGSVEGRFEIAVPAEAEPEADGVAGHAQSPVAASGVTATTPSASSLWLNLAALDGTVTREFIEPPLTGRLTWAPMT